MFFMDPLYLAMSNALILDISRLESRILLILLQFSSHKLLK